MSNADIKSYKAYRFAQNPEEERFFNKFLERFPQAFTTIQQIIDNEKTYATERDVQVFMSAIQWLGSPVGQYFLREMGYSLDSDEVEKKINTDAIKNILLKHSRNSGDYVPDYKYDKVVDDIKELFNG